MGLKLSVVIPFLTDVMEKDGDIEMRSITGFWIRTTPSTGKREVVCAVGDAQELIVKEYHMIEDKLTRDERIRLEALNQANASTQGFGTTEAVIEKAKRFETYIKGMEAVPCGGTD